MRDLLPRICLFVFFIAGCSSSKNFYIEPDYRNNKLNSPMLIVPIERDWFDNDTRHMFGHLSGNGKNMFYASIGALFSETFDSKLEVVDRNENISGSMFEPANLETGSLDFTVMVPRKETAIEKHDFSPRIILILDQYYFQQKEENISGSSYAGHEGEVQKFLYFETKYVYWDIETDTPLAWGVSDAVIQVSRAKPPSNADYQRVLARAVHKIANQGPLI